MEERILAAMQTADKPLRAGDAAKAMGVNAKEITKGFDKFKKNGRVVSSKRCFWQPA